MSGRLVTMFVRNDLRSDSRVWKEAATLRDAGWRVRLIGVLSPVTRPRETIDGIEVARVRLEPLDSRIVKVLRKPRPATFAPAPAAQAGAAPAVRGRRSMLGQLRALWGPLHDELATHEFTRQSLKIVGPEAGQVFHAHDLNAVPPALRASERYRGRFVFDAHEFFSERNFFRKPGARELRGLRAKEAAACRAADACITVSESIADELQRRYGLARRPVVVMNSPATATAASGEPLRARVGIAPADKIIVYIGAVTWNRGLEQTLAALPQLQEAHLVLLGPEQQGYRPVLERAAAELGVAGRLHFFGSVPPAAVVATAAQADAAVVLIQNACLSYYFCSPNKLFEALAAGLPVVASDFPDIARVLRGSGVGVLVDPAKPEAIASALREVFTWPRPQISATAEALAAAHSWERQREKLLAVYEQFKSQRMEVPV